MELFEKIAEFEHEQVVLCSNKEIGLKAIIAIHNTSLGPAVGGTRMWNYQTVEEAMKDVLRLSRGMTYKAAAAGLNLGGGKAVILGNENIKSEVLFRAFGRFVQGLGGRYITAEDVGTNVNDMEYVRMETQYVTGISRALGGSGDPSPITAIGTYYGIKACVNELKGNDSLENMTIAVQGCGQVAYHLIKLLVKENTKLYVCDINKEKIKKITEEFKVEVIDPEKIYDTNAEIFIPCALGGIINDETIPRLKCSIIAGAANNQLADEKKHGKVIYDKNIIYAPDYVINAGGLINVSNELHGYNRDKAVNEAKNIYNIVKEVLEISKRDKIPSYVASNLFAEKRIRGISNLNKHYVGQHFKKFST